VTDEALERVIEALVHDLNNYLAIISGRAELSLERAGDSARPDIEAVLAAAEAASGLLGRLASVLPSAPTHLEAVDLSVLLQHEPALRDAAGNRVSFELRVAPSLPRVRVDLAQLERALLELVDNAREAMTSGGTVTVEAVAIDASVAIVVRDTGPGLAPEVAASAAEPFATTKPRREGAGLGLTIARAIARRAGGELRIESAAAKGTVVSIVLPAVT
jgi:two-component system, NtrC family, sensor kinase